MGGKQLNQEDGHSPDICNWVKCGNPDAVLPCPFVKSKDEYVELGQDVQRAECKHEWRQYFQAADLTLYECGFYCIHCRKIE